jgi:ketosteroid isomerase-like protein
MDEMTFKTWLDAYGRAWHERDPHAAAELYTEEGTYQVTPFLQPIEGRKSIRDYWDEVAQTEKDITFSYEILVVNEQFGIAHWRASFERTPQGLKTKLDGIFAIRLDASGKCTSLREWWHKQQ